MGFSYLSKSSTVVFPKNLKIPKDTADGNKVAAQALAYANKTGKEVTFRFASYSESGAIKEKIDLAKEYELRGIAMFKIDGEEDQKVWKLLK
jgi:spore germination protein YaaH